MPADHKVRPLACLTSLYRCCGCCCCSSAQVWDPEAAADTSAGHNRHQHKVSPYTDMPLKGQVLATFVKGHKVYDEQEGVFEGHCGSVVRRKWLDVIRETKEKVET